MSQPASTFAATGASTHLSISIDGGQTFQEVFGVKGYNFGGRKKDFEDKTVLLSPGKYKEKQPTLRDSGEISVMLFFNPVDPGQILLAASFDVLPDQLLVVKLAYDGPTLGLTTGPVKTFSGYVSDYPDPPADVSKLTEQTIKINITGPITTVAGN